jgi:hypothetical protein
MEVPLKRTHDMMQESQGRIVALFVLKIQEGKQEIEDPDSKVQTLEKLGFLFPLLDCNCLQ